MDGKGRWMDNVFIERFWWSLIKDKYVYLQDLEHGSQARTHIGAWLSHYNHTQPHSTFGGQTPDEVYQHRLGRGRTLERGGKRHNINQINCSVTSPQICLRK